MLRSFRAPRVPVTFQQGFTGDRHDRLLDFLWQVLYPSLVAINAPAQYSTFEASVVMYQVASTLRSEELKLPSVHS